MTTINSKDALTNLNGYYVRNNQIKLLLFKVSKVQIQIIIRFGFKNAKKHT